MLLIDKPGTGRSVSRYAAADIRTFTDGVEYGFAMAEGEIHYAATVVVDGSLYGAVFCWPGESEYSHERVSEGILQLYADLATEGVIGPESFVQPGTVTLTGNPLGDVIQVADAMLRPDEGMVDAVARRYAATHVVKAD
ncbi:MAG: hypothetical protein V4772_03290 [Pseudomonadota bacterium]